MKRTLNHSMTLKVKKMAQTFTSNYGQLAKDKGADITKVDGFNQAMDLLLSNRVDGTFNDSLSYLDYKKKKTLKLKQSKEMQNKVNQHSHLTKMLMIKLYLISMMDLKH